MLNKSHSEKMTTEDLDNGGISTCVEKRLRLYFCAHKDGIVPPGLYDRLIKEIDRALLKVILEFTGQSQVNAAKILGISRNTLRKKINSLKAEV